MLAWNACELVQISRHLALARGFARWGKSRMLAALRSRATSVCSQYHVMCQWKLGLLGFNRSMSSPSVNASTFLDLEEVEKILCEVKADDVKIIPVRQRCDYADFMVIATGRSTWHVKNIAQALIFKAKQKQRGAERLLLPSVEGQEGGKWIVIDSGKVIVHALDEKARAYYNLENLWTSDTSSKGSDQDFEKALAKTRRKNNSKKPVKSST